MAPKRLQGSVSGLAVFDEEAEMPTEVQIGPGVKVCEVQDQEVITTQLSLGFAVDVDGASSFGSSSTGAFRVVKDAPQDARTEPEKPFEAEIVLIRKVQWLVVLIALFIEDRFIKVKGREGMLVCAPSKTCVVMDCNLPEGSQQRPAWQLLDAGCAYTCGSGARYFG